MFIIELEKHSSKYDSDLLLDLVVKYKADPTKFHITFTAKIDPVFEDGFCIKDATLYNPQNMIIAANTLFSEQEITEFKKHNIGSGYNNSWSNNLTALAEALQNYICFTFLENVRVKYYIPQEFFTNAPSNKRQ